MVAGFCNGSAPGRGKFDPGVFLLSLPTRQCQSNASVFSVPNHWHHLRNLGKGSTGCVAAYRRGGEEFAVKKICNVIGNATRTNRLLREVCLMLHCAHRNIVGLHELYFEGPQFVDAYLRMELMESDLSVLIHGSSGQMLRDNQIDCIIYQVLRGLYCLHSASVMHRDIKPSNILLAPSGTVKIADFGLARTVKVGHGLIETEKECLTERVVTRYYRAPEVVLTPHDYGFPIDLWAVGCIFGEMLTSKIVFKGSDSLDQLKKIIIFLGTPGPGDLDWIPSQSSSHGFITMCSGPENGAGLGQVLALRERNQQGNQLFRSLLEFHPRKRPTAKQAVYHPSMSTFAPQQDRDVESAANMSSAGNFIESFLPESIGPEIIEDKQGIFLQEGAAERSG